MVIYGTHTYGRVDEVPGFGHVATQFFMLNYVPIIPVGSYFVTAEESDGIRGVKLPLQLKSIGVAYLRAILFVGIVALAIVSIIGMVEVGKGRGGEAMLQAVGGGIGALICVGLFIGSYRVAFINNASYDKAIYLAGLSGFSLQGRLMLDVMYGRMTAEQADAVLAAEDAKVAELVDPTMGPGGSNSV